MCQSPKQVDPYSWKERDLGPKWRMELMDRLAYRYGCDYESVSWLSMVAEIIRGFAANSTTESATLLINSVPRPSSRLKLLPGLRVMLIAPRGRFVAGSSHDFSIVAGGNLRW